MILKACGLHLAVAWELPSLASERLDTGGREA